MHAVRRGSGLFRLLSTQSPLFCFLASARILHRQSSPPTSQSSPDWLFWWRQLFQRVCLGEKAHWSIIQGERVWEQGEGKCRRDGKKKESSRVGIRIQPVQNRKIMQGKFPFTKRLHSFSSTSPFFPFCRIVLHSPSYLASFLSATVVSSSSSSTSLPVSLPPVSPLFLKKRVKIEG